MLYIVIMNVFSVKFNLSNQTELRSFLYENGAEFFSQNYTIFKAKIKSITIVLYESGKLVIQGKNIDSFVDKLNKIFALSDDFVSEALESGKKDIETEVKNYDEYIGVDESGKGDFFGPLVIAGVRVTQENRQFFINLGIKDSKKLDDKTIKELAIEIQKKAVYSIVTINPLKYNELYGKFKNLNKLLAWGHARVIENILEKAPCEYALSDKFADESLIKNALMKKGRNIILDQKIKAESDIAVASASVLARYQFVEKIESLSKMYNVNLPKGASNIVLQQAKEFCKKYSKDELINIAKLHFKTFLQI